MADCRECRECVEVVEGVAIRCGLERRPLPIRWPQAVTGRCDDFGPKPVDCRECAKCVRVVDGQEVHCRNAVKVDGVPLPIPWAVATSRDHECDDFEPKPADSPPASADREGADWLEPANGAVGALDESANLAWDYGFSAIRDRCIVSASELRRAIAAEEARRARPAAEDPRDALLRQCATDFARVRDCEPDLDAHLDMRRIASGALESLRAAGVEPAPEAAQEGKASR